MNSVERRYGEHLAAEGIESFWLPRERQATTFGSTALLTILGSKIITLAEQTESEQ